MLTSFKSWEELKNWELYDYSHSDGGHSCQLCGKHIKHVFKIRSGNDKSELGSECVRKVAATNGLDAMKGIVNLPEKARKEVRVNKKELSQEELEKIRNEIDEMGF